MMIFRKEVSITQSVNMGTHHVVLVRYYLHFLRKIRAKEVKLSLFLTRVKLVIQR